MIAVSRNVGLLILGFAVSAGFLQFAKHTPALSSLVERLEALSPASSSRLASVACTPDALDNEVFFVTCGGIY